MNHGKTCDAAGPMVRITKAYEKQLVCNRVVGHPDEHREYDPHTFALLGEWDKVTERIDQPTGRRRVKA